jgi:hypothetical protein
MYRAFERLHLVENAFGYSAKRRSRSASLRQQIGAAGIGPSYQFTNAPPTCEEAQVMAAMHAPVHKFRLVPPYGTTLLQFWQTDVATVCITSLPFQSLVFWATPTLPSNVYGSNIASPAYYQQNYNELYALAVWLRTAYVGNRQYEWRDRYHADPDYLSERDRRFNIHQKAINDAIAAPPTSDVMVYHYVEVNAVQTAMSGSARVINSVVPYLNPMPDFVSYSEQLRQPIPKRLDAVASGTGLYSKANPAASRWITIGVSRRIWLQSILLGCTGSGDAKPKSHRDRPVGQAPVSTLLGDL